MSETINIRQKLHQYKNNFGIIKTLPCYAKANKECQQILKNGGSLPKNFYPIVYDDKTPPTTFYKVVESDLSDAEIQEYLTYRKLDYIKTIKNCVVFFTILTVLSVIVSIIFDLSILA